MDWGVGASAALARDHLAHHEPRWSHVCGVGELAETLLDSGLVDEVVASAAWLHDIGYASNLVDTGLHALDGARYLAALGAPAELVALVAHHTGAGVESEVRGLAANLQAMPYPLRENLDALTLVDLAVGPHGNLVEPRVRVTEILSRYQRESPVFQAVARSGPDLLRTAAVARSRMGLPAEWPEVAAPSPAHAEAHSSRRTASRG